MLKWQVSSPSSWSPNKSSSGYLSDNSLDVYNIKKETELNYFSDTENVQFTRFSYEPNHIAYIKNCRVFSGEQHRFLVKDSKILETNKNNSTLNNINKKLYQINENASKIINTSNNDTNEIKKFDLDIDISDISLTDVSSIEDYEDYCGRKSLQHNFDENQIDISLQELAKWITLVTDINLPCRDILTTLKDGCILKQFILKLSGEETIFKKLRKSLPWNTTDNISCFLRQCKKFYLDENVLFTAEDWNYVTTNDNLQRIKDKEWYQRVKKILMAFFCLAGKIKSDPKCSHFIKDVNIDVFKVKVPHTLNNEFSYYSSHCTSMSTMTPLTTDSETTIKRSKRVTFEDRVIQRYCSIESISESISSISYNIYPPPSPYGDYIEPYYHKKEDLDKTDEEKEKTLKMYHSETKTNGSAPYADDYYPAYRPNDDTGYRSTEELTYRQPCAPVYSQNDQTDYLQPNQNDTDTPEDHNTEFVTFHSYLNAPSPKKNSFKFSLNSPRTRSKNRDHNNNSSFKKKKNKDPEYWIAGQAGYDTIEKKKKNKLSSQSFKLEKPTENNSAFMRAKSASNLSSSSFKREKPLNKFASLSLKQEKAFSTSTPERPLSPPYRGSEVLNTNFDITKTQNNTPSPDKNMFRNNATSFSEHPISFGIAAMNSRDTNKYNTIDKSSTYQESMSKKEIKDLNNLLKLFDMDKVDCGTGSSEDEGTLTRNNQKEKEQISQLKINKAIQSSKTNQITNQSIEIPKDLNDVVNELLSVGNANTLTRNNTIQLRDSYTNNKKNTLTKRSIENFFDDNNIFNEIEKLNELTIEDNSSTYYESSDCESDHSLIEIDDSGIDETMPGLTKNYNKDIIDDNKPSTSKSHHSSPTDKTESKHRSENGHRRKKHHGDRKHRHDKNENESSGVHRSHSEPRKRDKKEKEDDRSESIPRSHSYSVKTKEKHDKKDKDKKEKRDKNGDSKEHRGRKKERRSEPTASKKPPTDKNTRRSEPIITNKIRSNNEIEGGAIGVYNKTGTTQRPPLKKTISFSDQDRNVVLPVQPNEKLNPSNGVNLQRNNSVHLSPKSREYMWDTADGKQRVYVRSKEDTKNVPPATIIKSKSPAKEEIVDQLGISPEIMNMLKEEEKFWQKQQELKNWRETRTSVKNKQYERNTRNSIKSRDNSRDGYNSENLREIEEDRMEREAARLMKVRAEQEHVLRTSKENLLKDETDTSYHYQRNDRDRNQFFNQNNSRNSYHQSDNPNRNIYANSPPRHPSSPPTRNPYQGEIRSSRGSYGSSDARSPRSQYKNNNDYEHRQNQNRQQNYNGYISSSVTSPREYDDSSWSANSPKSPKSPKYSPTRPVNGHISPRSNTIYERSKDSLVNSQKPNYLLQSGCFSDDDEVFTKKRPVNHDNDNRGYYSDHDSKTVGRTYNARPVIHQRKVQLNCTGCRRVISDERLMNVEGHSYYWHLKCFYCVVCRAFLNDNHAIRIRIVNYNLHCRFCYSAQNGEQLSEV